MSGWGYPLLALCLLWLCLLLATTGGGERMRQQQELEIAMNELRERLTETLVPALQRITTAAISAAEAMEELQRVFAKLTKEEK